MTYSFQAKISARGYHVCNQLAWSNAEQGDFVTVEIERNEESKKVDPYSCAIKAMVYISQQLKTVEHVPREISRHAFFFLKEENGKVDGFAISRISNSCKRVRNSTKTEIQKPQFYNTSKHERLHDKFVLV